MARINPTTIHAKPKIPELELRGAVTTNSNKLNRLMLAVSDLNLRGLCPARRRTDLGLALGVACERR